MNKIIVLFAAIIIAGSVNAQPPNLPAESGATFGEKITADDAISVEQLVNRMALHERQTKAIEVKLKGTVTSVCEEMGCWLKIKSAGSDMMIKMKDHSFFVPLAINGKEIIIDGIAEEKVTSVEQLRHYAQDAGKSKEEIAAITEPKKEIIISAKGVLVL